MALSQVGYRDRGDWPIAADGAGHTLVLQNIHEPGDDWRNWVASEARLGTPGVPEKEGASNRETLGDVLISEVHFAEDHSVDWVEVVHRSGPAFAAEELRMASKTDFSDAVVVPVALVERGRLVVRCAVGTD